MPYVHNILKYLAKHYVDQKDPKKKLSASEELFCTSLIKKIDSFCKTGSHSDREKFDKFKQTGLSVSTYISKYKIKDPAKFKRIVKKLEQSSPLITKYQQIKESVHRDFLKARANGENIHQNGLRKWARNHSKALGLKRSCSSLPFAKSIKKKYRLVSRRIQQHRNFNSRTEDDLVLVADLFVEEMSQIFPLFDPANIWNSDQVGINYEPTQKRTLETKGTKLVSSHIKSKNKTTHSFTIQPCVSLTGQLNSKLLIVLQESVTGRFGPLVEPRVRQVEEECGNVIVRSSTSGNVNKTLLEEWIAQFKIKPGNKLLLWDSLSFQKTIKETFQEKNVLRIELIPENTTKYAQPLDSLINIQIKHLYKHLFWQLQSKGYDMDRYLIIKLCSIVWNQLESVKFKDLIQAGWSSCLYQSEVLNDNHLNYQKVKDVCCLNELFKCDVPQCQQDSAIRCSHCEKQLCGFHLAIENVHLHPTDERN